MSIPDMFGLFRKFHSALNSFPPYSDNFAIFLLFSGLHPTSELSITPSYLVTIENMGEVQELGTAKNSVQFLSFIIIIIIIQVFVLLQIPQGEENDINPDFSIMIQVYFSFCNYAKLKTAM